MTQIIFANFSNTEPAFVYTVLSRPSLRQLERKNLKDRLVNKTRFESNGKESKNNDTFRIQLRIFKPMPHTTARY